MMNRNIYTKIAYWYYTLELTQDEIAKRLGLTRQKVNQIINTLKEQDIVHITVRGFEQENAALESTLEEKYGLKECIIASDYGEADTAVYKVALVAAQYLENTLRNGDTVGVSWGRTPTLTVEQMHFAHKPDCKVVSLLGALNLTRKARKSDELARNLANKLDCPSIMLYAPLIVENPETKQWLMKESHIKQSFDFMRRCDLAILGIGTPAADTSVYSKTELTTQRISSEFVCDFAANLIRADGSFDRNPLQDRLFAADMEILRAIPNTVAVAAGTHKAEAIRAALRSGCINTLIIDETTARLLIGEE